MKKIVTAASILLSLGAIAQQTRKDDSKMNYEKQMKNEIMMIDGKMTIMKNGKTKMMAKDIILPNGSVVSPNGIIKMKNGKIMQMKNGEMMVIRPNVMKMEK